MTCSKEKVENVFNGLGGGKGVGGVRVRVGIMRKVIDIMRGWRASFRKTEDWEERRIAKEEGEGKSTGDTRE